MAGCDGRKKGAGEGIIPDRGVGTVDLEMLLDRFRMAFAQLGCGRCVAGELDGFAGGRIAGGGAEVLGGVAYGET